MEAKKRILIIDDEKDIRDIIAENLRESGYEIIEAEDGSTITEILTGELKPSVVITDVIMPGRDGIETLLEIRESHPQVKVIAMSGGGRHRNMDVLQLAERLGADVVLPKPLDMDELERTIEDMVV